MRNGHIFLARACPGMGPFGTGRLGQCPFGKFLARALTIGQRALNGHTLPRIICRCPSPSPSLLSKFAVEVELILASDWLTDPEQFNFDSKFR